MAAPGMLIVWMNIAPGHEEDFDGWFTRQHVPERVGVPGFRAGGRYEAIHGEPRFLSVYETDSPEVLSSAPYKERLNTPTEWTQRVMPQFRDTIRVTGTVIVEAGHGIGGVRRIYRINSARGMRDKLREALRAGLVERLVAQTGVVRARVVETVAPTATANTAEIAIRGPDQTVEFSIVVDVQDASALAAVDKTMDRDETLVSNPPVAQPPAIGDYKLLFHLSR